MAHDVVLTIEGADAAEELARIWERATARLRSEPVPSSPDPARVAALAGRVGPPTAAAVLAVDAGQAIACCFIEQLVDSDGTPVEEWGHLSGVAVEPHRWGEGLASAVIAHAEVAAVHRGYKAMQLHVLEDNVRARRLYEHLGWTLSATGHPHPAGPQAVYGKALST